MLGSRDLISSCGEDTIKIVKILLNSLLNIAIGCSKNAKCVCVEVVGVGVVKGGGEGKLSMRAAGNFKCHNNNVPHTPPTYTQQTPNRNSKQKHTH